MNLSRIYREAKEVEKEQWRGRGSQDPVPKNYHSGNSDCTKPEKGYNIRRRLAIGRDLSGNQNRSQLSGAEGNEKKEKEGPGTGEGLVAVEGSLITPYSPKKTYE